MRKISKQRWTLGATSCAAICACLAAVPAHAAQTQTNGQETSPPPAATQPTVAAQSGTPDPVAAPSSGEQNQDIIVTGVFEKKSKLDAALAISTITDTQIAKTVPLSALDLLSNVPGVQVDSSAGEIRTTIVSRGLNGGFGGTFIAIEEDGLPVTGTSYDNYSPDYYLRSDLTLASIEALRGGSSAVFGPNAPGGIFNFISKTGGPTLAGTVSAMFGLQGNGKLPFYRGDFNIGGPLGDNWRFNVGGFLRYDYGAHDTGYPLDKGGQIKANISKTFAGGSVQFYGKYLNDSNGFNDPTPAVDFSSPHDAPGWTNTSSVMAPPVSYNFVTGPNSTERYDTRRQIHSKAIVLGFKGSLDLGDGWNVDNNFKYSLNKANWNYAYGIYQSVDNFLLPLYLGVFGRPGTYTYKDQVTGASAVTRSVTGFDQTVLSNSLGGQNLFPNAILTQVAYDPRYNNKEFMDQLTVTKKLGRLSLSAGGYADFSTVLHANGLGGLGFSTFQPKPHMLDVTLLTPQGQTLYLTNPAGFSSAPNYFLLNRSLAKWRQLAGFAGAHWDFATGWFVEGGIRFENVRVKADNTAGASPAQSQVDPDPTHIYNQFYAQLGPNYRVDRSIGTTSYSAAINHIIDSRSSVYLRYSSAEKSPDLSFYAGINSAQGDGFATIPQKLKQAEFGYNYVTRNLNVSVAAYYSLLSQIREQLLNSATSTIEFAFTPANRTRNIGIEFDGYGHLDNGLGLRVALTIQQARQLSSYLFTQPNGPGPISDAVLTNSGAGRPAANTPDVLASVTPSYESGPFLIQAQWRYVGKRPADTLGSFNLPAYSHTDLTVAYKPFAGLTLSALVNNIFNNKGVTDYGAPIGPGLNSVVITPAFVAANPNAVFQIQEIQARSFFIKASFNF